MPKKDLRGWVVNHLTVLEETPERSKDGSVMWLCRCDCGNLCKVPTHKLTSGRGKSCGCAGHKALIEYNKTKHKIDLTGQVFGLLTVLKEVPERSKDRQVQWLCQCECGNTTIVRSADLRSGNTKSCGCHRTQSFGEDKIKSLLKSANITFETEKTFDNCRFPDTNRLARFDFYLPENNLLIEYDGQQHFIQGKGLFDNQQKFEETQKRDSYKNKWCEENHIQLKRIPYTKLDTLNIDDLLV